MTEPVAPLIDLARNSELMKGFTQVEQGIEAARGDIAKLGAQLSNVVTVLAELTRKVTVLMSEDATVAAEAAQIETDQAAIGTALTSIQQLFAALQAEVSAGNLSQATLDALTKAQSDMDALAATAGSDATSDAPSSTPVTGSGS